MFSNGVNENSGQRGLGILNPVSEAKWNIVERADRMEFSDQLIPSAALASRDDLRRGAHSSKITNEFTVGNEARI